jgi:predicted deacetylase
MLNDSHDSAQNIQRSESLNRELTMRTDESLDMSLAAFEECADGARREFEVEVASTMRQRLRNGRMSNVS